MTPAERQRVGLALRALRVRRGLHQVQLATQLKMAVGTLQAIESGSHEVRDANLEKVARCFKTTVEQLLREGDADVRPGDPRLARITSEDLEIARAYHEARTDIRQQVRGMLANLDPSPLSDAQAQRARHLADRIMHLSAAQIAAVDTMVTHFLMPDTNGPQKPSKEEVGESKASTQKVIRRSIK